MKITDKNIDWKDFPCETCPSYGETDDCICSRLGEWSERQQRSEMVKDSKNPETPKSLYENIVAVRELVEKIKISKSYSKDLTDALMDVVTYADDCYVDHCEEIGKIAIENIGELEKQWREDISHIDEDALDVLTKEEYPPFQIGYGEYDSREGEVEAFKNGYRKALLSISQPNHK